MLIRDCFLDFEDEVIKEMMPSVVDTRRADPTLRRCALEKNGYFFCKTLFKIYSPTPKKKKPFISQINIKSVYVLVKQQLLLPFLNYTH